MEAMVKIRRINQMNYPKCNQQKEPLMFLYKNYTMVEMSLCLIKERENVKFVKVKVEKMSNNVLHAKVKVLLPKWYKLVQVCIHKWPNTAKIVMVRVIFLVKEESVKVVKEIVLLKKQQSFKYLSLKVLLQDI